MTELEIKNHFLKKFSKLYGTEVKIMESIINRMDLKGHFEDPEEIKLLESINIPNLGGLTPEHHSHFEKFFKPVKLDEVFKNRGSNSQNKNTDFPEITPTMKRARST